MTRQDYQAALEQIMQPLRAAILSTDRPGLNLGSSGAVYDQKRAEMEALVRPLWGSHLIGQRAKMIRCEMPMLLN